jgi:hypothetical protein
MDSLLAQLRRLFILPGGQPYHRQNETGEYPPTGTILSELRKLTPGTLERHLRGEETVALNLVSPEGLTRVAMLDFDGAAHGKAARDWQCLRTVAAIVERDLGLPAPAVSISGRKGYGLWWSLHMFTNPTGISINPTTCASTMAGTSRGRRQAPPHGAGPAVGV